MVKSNIRQSWTDDNSWQEEILNEGNKQVYNCAVMWLQLLFKLIQIGRKARVGSWNGNSLLSQYILWQNIELWNIRHTQSSFHGSVKQHFSKHEHVNPSKWAIAKIFPHCCSSWQTPNLNLVRSIKQMDKIRLSMVKLNKGLV